MHEGYFTIYQGIKLQRAMLLLIIKKEDNVLITDISAHILTILSFFGVEDLWWIT